MANKKISELTAITTLAETDVFPVVDVSASTTNKVSVSDLLRNAPDGTADAPSIANAGDQDTGIFFPAANSVGVSTAGTQKLVIDSFGNVGIGTTSPASLLHLKSDTPYIRFEDDNDNQDWQIEARAFFGIYDVTDSTFRFAIDGDGNVGIGTTSTGAVVSGMPTLHLASTTAGRSGAIRWKNTGETNKAAAYWFGTEFQIGTETSHSLKFTTADTERMRIDGSGNVGIGTTSPSTKFVVSNSGAEGVEFSHASGTNEINSYNRSSSARAPVDIIGQTFKVLTGNPSLSTGLFQNSSGNVGIGTASPAFKLHCVESGSFAGICASSDVSADALASRFALGNSVGTARFTVNMKGGSNELAYLGSEGNFPIYFQTVGAERMRIDSSGRVLVGTSSGSGEPIAAFQGRSNDANDSGIVAITRTGTNPSGSIGELRFATGSDFNKYYGMIICASDGSTTSTSLPGVLRFSTTASGNTAPTERFRIDSNGQALFYSTGNPITSGTSQSAGTTHEVFTGVHSRSSTTSGGTVCIHIFSNGNIQNTNNSYGQISDVKLKENIVNANSQWDDIKDIQVRNFNFKEETGNPTHTQIGVVAQELETVSPGLVYEMPDTDDEGNNLGTVTKSVNYSVLYMKAVKALQEAMDRIETLETKVAALEAQ